MNQAETLNITLEQAQSLDPILLDPNMRVKLLPAAFYDTLDRNILRAWCGVRARYVLPTEELIAWLKQEIGDRTALEIGAGHGDLGRLAGVPMTDSYQQVEDSATVAYFQMYSHVIGMSPTRPPPDVEKEDGEQAVRRRKPDIVIAAYVTEKHVRGSDHGNYKGIRYDYIIKHCAKFILIGTLPVHGTNRALKLNHRELHFPWLVSRTANPCNNRIWVWSE